jgi:peptidoglycan/LPS O-acetylase OafA/YrhL
MLIHSPLHLLWAGPEAVIVFFLLSGFVLTLPTLHPTRFSWFSYFPKRLVRLYVPVTCSVAFALVIAFLVPRNSSTALSWWVNSHDREVGVGGVVREIFLLAGTGRLNSPLWSLRWEVFFSLMLPLYVYLASKIGRLWILGAVSMIAMSEAGRLSDSASMTFLPMFGIGVLMAANLGTMRRWGEQIMGWRAAVITAVSLLLLSCSWYVPGIAESVSPAILGGCGLLLVCIASNKADALGSQPVVHWLGSRSFSLYLVHEPLIVSAAMLLHTNSAVLVTAVAVPASLVVSEIFFRLVEDPSRRLANMVGPSLSRPGRIIDHSSV